MKRFTIPLLALSAIAPGAAFAEICLTEDGFVVECPETGPSPVQAYFDYQTLPRHAGVPSDIYMYGGGDLQSWSGFYVFANGEFLCSTDSHLDNNTITPIRHCVGTVSTPGTYVISVSRIDGNFMPPPDTTIVVQP